MKVWKIFLVMVVLFLFNGMVLAEEQKLPSSGKYVVGTPAGVKTAEADEADFRITMTIPAENAVIFTMPFLKRQFGKEGLTNPDWQLFASWAWTDGEKWILVPQEDYAIKTESVGDSITGRLAFPKKGNGWYWTRVWAQDKKSGNFLWINQTSRYGRNDTNGSPGYEFLGYPARGRYQPVPSDYQTRR
jgi:hypothetical protein